MIYVFRTSVKYKKQIRQLSPLLNDLLPQSKWNFDLEDRDRILRIDSEENIVLKTINLLTTQQFHCEELE